MFPPRWENLTIRLTRVIYAYDHQDGTTLLIENNIIIDLGEDMVDILCNSIQSEEAGVRVDLRPGRYYKDDVQLQSL